MSILNTFLNKISRKEPSRSDDKNSIDGKSVEIATDVPRPKYIDTPHGRVKFKQYNSAKSYFDKLHKLQHKYKDHLTGVEVSLDDKTKSSVEHSSLSRRLFMTRYMDQLGSDLLWKWVEQPSLSYLLPKKDVWWTMSEKNEYFPEISEAPFGDNFIFYYYFAHCIIWIPVFLIYFNNPICKHTKVPVLIGFFFGLILMSLIDILNNNNTDILVDRNKMRWTLSHSEKQIDDITVIKTNPALSSLLSPQQQKIQGLVFKPEKFEETAANKNLKLIPLKDWYSNDALKFNAGMVPTEDDLVPEVSAKDAQKDTADVYDDVRQRILMGSYQTLSSSAYYIISSIVTIGIVTARAHLKYFGFITPLILLISFITICGIYSWTWSYHASQSYDNLNLKRKILVESISLSITCCLLALNCINDSKTNKILRSVFL